MRYCIVLLFACLTGCAMSNKMIIETTKYCRENNMAARPLYNNFAQIIDIQCEPKAAEEKR